MSWLAGYVKEVQSGDTVVITSNRQLNGALAEKRLNLASLSSPRMVCVSIFLLYMYICYQLPEGKVTSLYMIAHAV